jgi:formate-dependent phosphoribosylglycinamide formyltransferase (GAR transformylase)
MGVALAVGDNVETARQRAADAARAIKVTPA